MSALMMDEIVATVVPVRPTRPSRGVWVHRGPAARPIQPTHPGARPVTVATPPAVRPISAAPSAGWQLTERGIAVVIALLALVMMVSAVVVVSSFLAIPNTPVDARMVSGVSQVVAPSR